MGKQHAITCDTTIHLKTLLFYDLRILFETLKLNNFKELKSLSKTQTLRKRIKYSKRFKKSKTLEFPFLASFAVSALRTVKIAQDDLYIFGGAKVDRDSLMEGGRGDV